MRIRQNRPISIEMSFNRSYCILYL